MSRDGCWPATEPVKGMRLCPAAELELTSTGTFLVADTDRELRLSQRNPKLARVRLG